VEEAAGCWICGHSPTNPWRSKPAQLSVLCIHEIARGSLRQKALDCGYACLVACFFCNQYEVHDRTKWPDAKQLAVLKLKAPDRYDLVAFNRLFHPVGERVSEAEVREWLDWFSTQ
jgi:hypothetical protein